MWHFEAIILGDQIVASLTVRPAGGRWVVVVSFSKRRDNGSYVAISRMVEGEPYSLEGEAWTNGRTNLEAMGFRQLNSGKAPSEESVGSQTSTPLVATPITKSSS